VAQEIELKLEIDPSNLPLLFEDPLFASVEMQSLDQLTIYYDTAKTALKKLGFTLRVRNSGGRFVQAVKAVSESVGLLSREEIETDVASIEPEPGLLGAHPITRVLDGSDSAKLVPTIRSEVVRTRACIERDDSRIEIDVDRGTIAADGQSTDFAELEFELLEGPPASLIMAARRLADRLPVRLGVLTKAERGFRLASGAAGKVSKAGPIAIHGDMTVADAFELVVHACLRHYRLNEPLVILKRKTEALHQVRVAMRRLRSALSLFKPAIEDVEFQHLRHELRWFTSQLGDARNLDVYLERDLEADERAALIPQREAAYDLVIDVMNSPRLRRLMIDLVGWTAIGAWRSSRQAARPITGLANARLDRLWNLIATAGREIETMDEATRHGLRIQIKKLRYGIEFLRGLYPQSKAVEERFAAAVEALQQSLGTLNDLATARSIRTEPASDGWLIGSYEERRSLKSAEDAYRELLRAGPFWRAPQLCEA
jgi:triphosphatase